VATIFRVVGRDASSKVVRRASKEERRVGVFRSVLMARVLAETLKGTGRGIAGRGVLGSREEGDSRKEGLVRVHTVLVVEAGGVAGRAGVQVHREVLEVLMALTTTAVGNPSGVRDMSKIEFLQEEGRRRKVMLVWNQLMWR
jgi:hypothetical protein